MITEYDQNIRHYLSLGAGAGFLGYLFLASDSF